MSPYIRTMLEDAADDEGRPVGFDLTAVRSAGRRATWRHRAIAAGGGLGAAAVITSVALLLAPSGGGSGFQPTDDGTGDPKPTATDLPLSFDDAFAPLITALEANGYDVSASPFTSAVGMANLSSTGSSAVSTYLTAGTLSIKDGDAAGAAIAAEFSDVSAVTDIVLGDLKPPPPESEIDGYDYSEQCAVLPTDVHRSDFAWDTCEDSADGLQRIATGGDAYGDAIGVTLIRPDGSGVSLAVSTAAYERPVGGGEPATPSLDQMPLTSDELMAAAQVMLDAGPMFEVPVGEILTGEPGPEEPSPMPEKCPPDGTAAEACTAVSSADIETGALVDALAAAGITVADVGGTGSDGSDGDVAQSALLHLTDSEGRSGMASVGTASSLEIAPLMNGTSTAWCAVIPGYEQDYAWMLADDPTALCSDSDNDSVNPLVVVHTEDGADAIGATLVRADGSVISLSISQDPGLVKPGEELGEPLAELPLDRAAILEVLHQLDVANAVS